ncbi:hypothetical protein [Flagellimonas allohymeniacidonis]|uniref:Uncharacterized protein n=1 Tax=Flagellimonas allohymeniacidonis TaxID=2517819 RepID=A0A4Q8QFK4_9FLAO|nr:hypothetical protein [Allomuricauda hymeniacidonis]TAI47333.1 hypothetical protein EW142_11680 [Allomuricauda hymeniacidonis]
MVRYLTHVFFQFVFWVFILGHPLVLKSQEQQRYTGSFEIGSYQGDADYAYRLFEADTLLEGPFHMQSSNLDALLKDGDETFVFDGSFKDGEADGFWRFEFGSYTTDGNTRLVDGQYRLNINGTRFEAYGVINQGKPNGQWIFMVNELVNSSLQSNLFRSVISFEKGVPQRNVRIENEKSTLVGRFLRNGLAHDVWSRYDKENTNTSESWVFDEGLLNQITYEDEEGSTETAVFTESQLETKIVALNKAYLNLLNLMGDATVNERAENDIAFLLLQNHGYYQKITDILSHLGKTSFMPEFRVKVPQITKDSAEIISLDTIVDLYAKATLASELLLNNTQLQIIARSDTEVDFLYKALQKIDSDFLQPLKQLKEYHESGITGYLTTELLLQRLFPNGRPTANITVEIEKDGVLSAQTFTGPDAKTYNFESSTVTALEHMARYAQTSADSIASILNKKLASEQKQQELVELERGLIAQIKQLNLVIDSVGSNLPNEVSKTLAAIKKFGENKLQAYTAIQDNDTKVARGTELAECLKELNRLAIVIAGLPEEQRQLKEKYQDAVWNPFMATIMDEAVKKRIMSAYENVLIPYLLLSIQSELSCDNTPQFNKLLEQIHMRMYELRDENTTKLERKLKRERDPQIVLGLFNIQSKK